MTALNLRETYPSPKQILEENFDTLVSKLKNWSKNKMGIAKANKILEVINNNDTLYKNKFFIKE